MRRRCLDRFGDDEKTKLSKLIKKLSAWIFREYHRVGRLYK